MSNQQLTRNTVALQFAVMSFGEASRYYNKVRKKKNPPDEDALRVVETRTCYDLCKQSFLMADLFIAEMQRQEAGENPKTD